MINKATFKFLTQLSANNSKEWLDENRTSYEKTKNNILALTEALIQTVSEFDDGIAHADLSPKKCITRLNRDLRFSKDKTPYKTDYYIVLNQHGKNSPSAFYYVHIEPGNCSLGGGVYNPLALELKKIRSEISASFSEWKDIIGEASFQATFPSGIQHSGLLVRTPKGYEDTDPALSFLKMKGFFTEKTITDEDLQSKQAAENITNSLKASKPLVDFLNVAIYD